MWEDFWGADDSTSERILDVLKTVKFGCLVGCSKVSCSSQTWSARWRWRWYWLLCDRGMDGCSINENYRGCCPTIFLHVHQFLPLLSNSSTCKFQPFYTYCQIPLLANSTSVTFTARFQYLQLPPCYVYWQIPLLANSAPPMQSFIFLRYSLYSIYYSVILML